MAKELKKTSKVNFEAMPHSLEAEQALLGCILMDTKVQIEIACTLKEEDFYAESHKCIFNAMAELLSQNKSVDLVTLTDVLEKKQSLEQAGGITYITKLADVIPSSANAQRYYDIVTRDSTLRKLIKGSAEIITDCQTSTDKISSLGFAEKTIFDISKQADTSTVKKIGEILPNVMNTLDELSKDGSSIHGIKTQFDGIDNILNGLHKSDLMILAARPAVGKTSFAMNIVENVAMQGYSCAVFSLEMSNEQLAQRMLCSVANVSMEHAVKGKLDKAEWLRLAKAKQVLNNAKIYIDDSSMITAQEMLSKCRRIKQKYGLDLIMVDYIQLMNPPANKKIDNRQQEITDISRNLKIMAKELNVPVLALSQLSRAVEQRKGRPQLSDLRESGAIEQDADIVMFIHRPDKNATEKEIAENKVQANVAEILIEKHRAGRTGMVKLYFKGECTKFVNLPEGEEVENNADVYKKPALTSEFEDLPDIPPEENEDPIF